MRIAFLNPSGQIGGAEACLLDAIAALRKVRPEWRILVILGEEGPLASRTADLGSEVHLLPFPTELARLGDSGQGGAALLSRLVSTAPTALRYRFQLRALLGRLKPDVIHTNGFKMHILGALTKPLGTALVWHIHDYISSRTVMARLMRRLASQTDVIITNSESVADDTRTVLGSASKIVPILNVVDLEEFKPTGHALDLDQLSGLSASAEGTIRVGLLSTLAWWKGHRLFLEGLARLDPALPCRGYYIGGALYKTQSQESLTELREFAAQLRLGDRIGFTDVVSEPGAAMRALDMVVHTSTEPEPFGRVIVEAMACGKPVITTGLGGAAEILSLGDFALTINPNQPETLASAITSLAADPALRQRLGSNGLSTARQHFGRERLARELPPVYEEVLTKIHGTEFTHAARA